MNGSQLHGKAGHSRQGEWLCKGRKLSGIKCLGKTKGQQYMRQ